MSTPRPHHHSSGEGNSQDEVRTQDCTRRELSPGGGTGAGVFGCVSPGVEGVGVLGEGELGCESFLFSSISASSGILQRPFTCSNSCTCTRGRERHIIGGIVQSLSSNQRRQTTQHTPKIGVKGEVNHQLVTPVTTSCMESKGYIALLGTYLFAYK